MQKNRLTPEQEMERRSRRSFLALGAGAVAAAGGWEWILHQADADGIPQPLRAALGFNEKVVRGALYGSRHLAPTFPASAVTGQKVNGDDGMDDDVEDGDWRLEVVPFGDSKPQHRLTLAEVQALPKHEEIIDFKCVEGWSAISQFAGARLSDFTAKYASGSEKAAFVGMMTPSKKYYVGLDMPSALHPQTLLAYEMNGKVLEDGHGAPLRLVIPVKYGIKNIKRIGRIEFTDEQPADFWAEQGYDYYSGL